MTRVYPRENGPDFTYFLWLLVSVCMSIKWHIFALRMDDWQMIAIQNVAIDRWITIDVLCTSGFHYLLSQYCTMLWLKTSANGWKCKFGCVVIYSYYSLHYDKVFVTLTIYVLWAFNLIYGGDLFVSLRISYERDLFYDVINICPLLAVVKLTV